MKNIRLFQYHGKDTLTLPAKRELFAVLLDWLGVIAVELEMPDEIRQQIMMAADEIFTNIAMHAYPESEGTADVTVEYNVADRCLTMRFSDSGNPFDPLKATEPDLALPPEERSIGGLGIFLVRKVMDGVEYHRENGRNVLVLRKKLPNRG